MAIRRKRIVNLDKLWMEYYISPSTGLCAICANKGTFDITSYSPAGVKVVSDNLPCICPNGQTMLAHEKKAKR